MTLSLVWSHDLIGFGNWVNQVPFRVIKLGKQTRNLIHSARITLITNFRVIRCSAFTECQTTLQFSVTIWVTTLAKNWPETWFITFLTLITKLQSHSAFCVLQNSPAGKSVSHNDMSPGKSTMRQFSYFPSLECVSFPSEQRIVLVITITVQWFCYLCVLRPYE